MVSRGADATEKDIAAIVEYLTANFGKINVNTAAAPDIQKFLSLTEAEARAIVAYRDQNGKFKDFDALQKTPGVDAEKLKQKRSLIAFVQ
jgi:competence protein ComEA